MTKSTVAALVSQIVNPKLSKDEVALLGPASKIQLPEHSGGRLSPTQIGMYWRCGMQYYFRYVLGLKLPPAVAQVEGGSHHESFEDNGRHKIKTGKDRPAKHMCAVFADAFSDRQKLIPKSEWRLAETTKDKVIKRGLVMLRNYRESFAETLIPEFVEEKVLFKVGDVEVVGYVDVGGKVQQRKVKPFGTRKGIWDHKISGRKKMDDDVANAISLAHYGWGAIDLLKGVDLTKKPPEVGFITTKKTGQLETSLQSIPLSIGRIKWYRRQVLTVADAISRGAFPVRDGVGWQCSEKFCGYYKRCKGKVWKG